MSLLTLKTIHHSFGNHPVLDQVNLTIERGERICLVGRNGTGKSTLMKLIAGTMTADDGDIIVSDTTRISQLPQEVPEQLAGSVYDVVAQGLGNLGTLITQWHHAVLELAHDNNAMKRMEDLQQQIEAQQGWNLEQRISSTISRLELPGDEPFDSLSGGLKRRTLLAQALVTEPDLLLLDEPTNHLDIDAILWLESFLKNFNGSILFITHDRSFLQNLATRIIDLDRGQLTSWPGSYQKYLQAKQQLLDAEETANALFDKKLAQEEVWIRQGIKARRTRNEGRVRALEQMRRERSERREQSSRARISAQQAESSGKIVIEAEQVSFSWQGEPIIRDFDCKIQRGDKIGIIGPNGCGKSTLIQLLLGDIQPTLGHIKTGTRLEVAYFDQHRNELKLDLSVRENVSPGSDQIDIRGNSRHVIGYLKDFLFSPSQMNTPVSALSGGERNRLMLAKLFAQPFNFLIMDEPTNDLDIDTLELLEELLMDYSGTLLLVSHDRSFINHIVDSCLVFEGDAQVNEYVGGYDDWIRQRPEPVVEASTATKASTRPAAAKPAENQRKLSYNEQKELKSLPRKIEKLESEIELLQNQLADPGFYQQDQTIISDTQNQLKSLENQLESLYERWESLEN